jgi:phosphate transport system protein
MNELVVEQLRDVLEAYGKHDRITALDVWRRDDAVDAIYTSLFRALLTYMLEDPRNIMFGTHLLFCAKNLERIGDQTTNIAESVYYLVPGEPFQPTGQRAITQSRRHLARVREGGYTYGAVLDGGR